MQVRDFRDSLYEYITVSGIAVRLVDTPSMQRMRDIMQLGYAYTVYHEATHTRFEHMLGAYHLCKQVIANMRERGELGKEDEEEVELAQISALLHDQAHYPSAHLLEEYGLEEADHEKAAEAWLMEGEIGALLEQTGIPDAARRVAEIIRHEGNSPLRGLVAGALDVDNMDYLRRDPTKCGLPVVFEQARLVSSLTLAPHPVTGERTVMLYEKGLNALEDANWQRYSNYRKVYWHPVVRSASVMGRAMILQALESGMATLEEVQRWTDKELSHVLRARLDEPKHGTCPRSIGILLRRLEQRRLYKPVASLPLGAVPSVPATRLRGVEEQLARFLDLESWEVLLDVPHKPRLFDRDIHVVRKNGEIVHCRDLTPEDGYVINDTSASLYRAVGSVNLYTAQPREIRGEDLVRAIEEFCD